MEHITASDTNKKCSRTVCTLRFFIRTFLVLHVHE